MGCFAVEQNGRKVFGESINRKKEKMNARRTVGQVR